jgi:aminoglycoside phosphotransferase (APT) family kinase protein
MPQIDRQATFSGTREVAAPLAIDVGRLQGFLASQRPDVTGAIAVRQFKGGQSNPTYLLEVAGHRYVLRRKPPGKLLPSAHAVDREFRVISALHAQRFPVAEPVLYCEDAGVIGTAFYVMGFVEGRVLWEPHMPDADPRERAAVYDAMNATLARLHCFDPVALGLADFGRGENYVARQIERWSKQYRASQTERIDEMEGLIAWLPLHLPPPAPVRLVHGLAYHLMQWDMPPSETGAGVGSLIGHDLGALGIPSRADYVDAYVARTGLDPRPYLPVYLAYNFFRLAAILQGIVGRARDGTATSEKAAAMAPLVRPLAVKAWDFAREAGAR